MPGQRALVLRQLVPLPLRQVVPGQRVLSRQPARLPPKQVVPRQSALFSKEIELSTHRQLVARQSALTPREITLFLQAGTPQSESTSSQAVSAFQAGSSWAEGTDVQASSTSLKAVSTISQGDSAAPLMQVVHRLLAMALTPREIALFPLRQVVPGQRVLMPRQPVPLPKQSALTLRELALLPPGK